MILLKTINIAKQQRGAVSSSDDKVSVAILSEEDGGGPMALRRPPSEKSFDDCVHFVSDDGQTQLLCSIVPAVIYLIR